MDKIDRRQFIKQTAITTSTLAAGMSLAESGRTINKQRQTILSDLARYDFLMGRVKFDTTTPVYDAWNTWPVADTHLLNEFSKVVRCKIKPVDSPLHPGQPRGRDEQFNAVIDFRDHYEHYKYCPFALMTSEGPFTFNSMQRNNLKKYLESGGFLLMDDCVSGKGGDFFYKSAFAELETIFGKGSVVRIPNDHEIYHNVYDMGDRGLPYVNHGQQYGGRGVFIEGRLAVLLSPHDLHCGWSKPGWLGYEGYLETIKMGVNILMYAMSH